MTFIGHMQSSGILHMSIFHLTKCNSLWRLSAWLTGLLHLHAAPVHSDPFLCLSILAEQALGQGAAGLCIHLKACTISCLHHVIVAPSTSLR